MKKTRCCPYCNHPVGWRQASEYIVHGTAHTIECEGCGRQLRPTKYPLTFTRCYLFAVVFTIIFMNVMLYIFHLGFMKSLLYFLASAAVLFSALCVATILTTEFNSEK